MKKLFWIDEEKDEKLYKLLLCWIEWEYLDMFYVFKYCDNPIVFF